ncbi:hypothetical protein EJ02DRAFT_428649 [Clathrospora elynae]|uniref:Uncharacterized protein n=1 Tax=Clathrospora elynae TaxID=706981 RepID=A0A6A5S6J2_9PLEO|nr:hypothetical protein EJ02DRAFT_428649 [Clathrospora elynae]
MGIYDAAAFVPKLEANGLNFWKWDAAVAIGAKTKPDLPTRAGWIPDAELLDMSTIDINNNNDQDKLVRRAAFDLDWQMGLG